MPGDLERVEWEINFAGSDCKIHSKNIRTSGRMLPIFHAVSGIFEKMFLGPAQLATQRVANLKKLCVTSFLPHCVHNLVNHKSERSAFTFGNILTKSSLRSIFNPPAGTGAFG
jgi:hypothetical protein